MARTHVTTREIDAAAARYGIDKHVFRRLVRQESGGQIRISSPAGAIGPTQLMPDTARALGVDPHDPLQNLDGGAKYLRQMLDRFDGDYRLAAAAYNAGPGAVAQHHGVPPYAETQHYVRVVAGGRGRHSGPLKPLASTTAAQNAVRGPVRGVTGVDVKIGQDRTQERVQAALDFLHGKTGVLDFAAQAKALSGEESRSSVTPRMGLVDPGSGQPQGGGRQARHGGDGLATFEGVTVKAWMIPDLRAARANGWKGKISSGVRTRQEQEQLWANRGSNPYPVARPGRSNHEAENGGAIDVTDPDGFERALSRFKGRRLRRDPAIRDPVHFSATGR